LKANQPGVHAKGVALIERILSNPCHFETCTPHGDRIDVHRIWACPTTAEHLGFFGARQVFAVEREVIPKGKGVKASREINYAVSCHEPLPDIKDNAALLLSTYRGHWSIESKNHYRRDQTCREDNNPTRNRNAARLYAAFRQLAIFLCELGAHRPTNDRDRANLPELHRYCSINGIDETIGWFTNARRLRR
jgi:hypothetical protein